MNAWEVSARRGRRHRNRIQPHRRVHRPGHYRRRRNDRTTAGRIVRESHSRVDAVGSGLLTPAAETTSTRSRTGTCPELQITQTVCRRTIRSERDERSNHLSQVTDNGRGPSIAAALHPHTSTGGNFGICQGCKLPMKDAHVGINAGTGKSHSQNSAPCGSAPSLD